MFFRLFTTRFKCLVHDKVALFWTMLFPLVLATLFFFAFGNMMNSQESIQPIPVAVVQNDAYAQDTIFRQTLDAVSQQGEDPLFLLTYTDAQ